jgi:hypothetical protein
MLKASLYIAVCSTKNRIAVRLRRLREPRYLVGAILGVAYFAFVFLSPRRVGRRADGGRRGMPPEAAAAFDRFGPMLGGVGLLCFAVASWIFPSSSQLFRFTDAEVAFLFPAPVSRRQLIVHRLIRSQVGLLFAAIIPPFLFGGSATISLSGRLLVAVGLWVLLVTMRVYFAGVSMARAHLDSPDRRIRRVAWLPLLVTVGAFAAVLVPVARALLSISGQPLAVVLVELDGATATGPARMVLMPFRLLVGPFFADGGIPYISALGGALVVLLGTFAWVLTSDQIFQGADGYGPSPVPRHEGRGRGRALSVPRVRAAGWTLPLTGRPEALFFWKNAMRTLRDTNLKSLVPIAILIFYAVVAARFGMSNRLTAALSIAALMMAAFATLLGPGSVMGDLRGDLRHLGVLKTWPVKPSALLRGEMLWPGVLLTVCAWFALTCSVVLSGSAFPQLTFAWRVSLYAAAMVVVPALIFAQYTIHAAAAVTFPAWIPPDNEMRGFESMAQRLILFSGMVVALAAMVGPAAVAGGVIGLVFYRLIESPVVLVPAAAVCLAVLTIEVILATEILGPVYERIDLSGVERVE